MDTLSTAKKRGLVLSGGSAFGAFQVGALQAAADLGYNKWDLVAGVSVGALNGTMIALNKFEELVEIWKNISNDQVYTRKLNSIYIALALILCRQSILSNKPLQKKIKRIFNEKTLKDGFGIPMLIGTVSLHTGTYHSFNIRKIQDDLKNLRKIILASTAIPGFWPPVKHIKVRGKKYRYMVDGGLRNVSPLKNLVDYDRQNNLGIEEIVVINCNPLELQKLKKRPRGIINIANRSLLEIMYNETFTMDIKEHMQINKILDQIKNLKQPVFKCVDDKGKGTDELKTYKTHLIQPDTSDEMGDPLDFSKRAIKHRICLGKQKAKQKLTL